MRASAALLLLLLTLPLLAGCIQRGETLEQSFEPPERCPADTVHGGNETPECILRAADAFLVHMLGEERARTWVEPGSFQAHHSAAREGCVENIVCTRRDREGYYSINLRLQSPEAPFAKGGGVFVLFPDGTLMKNGPFLGIPPCRAGAELCEFSIDRTDAERIASRAGLARGIAPWESKFYLHGRHGAAPDRSVWVVSSLLSGDRWNGEYETVRIDAHDGRILKMERYRLRTVE